MPRPLVVRRKTTGSAQPYSKKPSLLTSLLDMIPAGSFPIAGSAIGGVLGGPTGAAIGGAAGNLLHQITGRGDYRDVTGSSNSIMDNTAIPTFASSSEGMRMSCKEFVCDVNGSVGFVNNGKYAINAGNSRLFPLLSQVAQSFEEVEWRGLVFLYNPTSGEYAGATNSAALGSITLATSYNVLNPAFASKQEMDAYEFSASGKPSNPLIHPIELKEASNPTHQWFIRNGSSASQQGDARLYDVGAFQYATKGQASVYNIGEIWVSYDVFLKKPKVNTSYSRVFHIQEAAAGTATASFILGTSTSGGTVMIDSFGDGTVGLGTQNQFVISRSGNYMVVVQSTSTAGTVTASVGLAYGTNFLGLNSLNDSAVNGITAFVSTNGAIVSFVTVSADGSAAANVVTLSGMTGMTAGKTDVIVTQLPTAYI